VLRTLRDVPDAPAVLDPPTLTMAARAGVADKAKAPVIERPDGRRIAIVLCVAAMLGAVVLIARARPRQPT